MQALPSEAKISPWVCRQQGESPPLLPCFSGKAKNYSKDYFAHKYGNCFAKFAVDFTLAYRCRGTHMVKPQYIPRLLGTQIHMPPAAADQKQQCADALSCQGTCEQNFFARWYSPLLTLERSLINRINYETIDKLEPSRACQHISSDIRESLPESLPARIAAIYFRGGDTSKGTGQHVDVADVQNELAWLRPWLLPALQHYSIGGIVVFGNRAAHSHPGTDEAKRSTARLDLSMASLRNLSGLHVWLAPEELGECYSDGDGVQTLPVNATCQMRAASTRSVLRDLKCMADATILIIATWPASPSSTFHDALLSNHRGCAAFAHVNNIRTRYLSDRNRKNSTWAVPHPNVRYMGT